MPILLSRAPAAGAQSELSVVCLCAAWCRTCDAYRPDLTALATRAPDARFFWLDVEDDADWVSDLEVETFPTLLVLARGTPLFFGPLPPQIGVFERTLQSLRDVARPAALDDEVADALTAIGARLLQWSDGRS